MTASEARRNWFRLLDEVIAGEEVVIERKGRRVVLRQEAKEAGMEEIPTYEGLISGPVEAADTWGWDWDPETGEVRARDGDAA